MIDFTSISEEERAIIEARRKYQKEWRKKNKDKIKQHNKRFYEKKMAEINNKEG